MTDEELINYNYTGVTQHTKMTMHDRAVQFSPFASLAGLEEMYDKKIKELDEKMEKRT